MERQIVFRVLDIEETKNEQEIKDAYRRKLRVTNPEDDPEGFKRLREAYETAVAWARQPEEETEKEKTEIDLWIDRVDEVYQDIVRRCQPEEWKEVLSDPLCEDLDTSLEAREALLVYVMKYIYFPHKILKLLDDTFQIEEDRESLSSQFPQDFLNYIIYYINNDDSFNFDLFIVRDRHEADPDAYILNYFDIKRQIDQGNLEGQEKHIDDLSAFGVYHPYEDVERLRLMYLDAGKGTQEASASSDGNVMEKIGRLVQNLRRQSEDDCYILMHCGEAYWVMGEKTEAYEIWKKLLERYPDHYAAKTGIVRCLMDRREYEKAKEIMLDLLDVESHDELILGLIKEANDALIEKYEKAISSDDGSEETQIKNKVELGWCLFQNERTEEALELLESFVPNSEEYYSYENLYGRALYRAEKYEQALPHLKKWLELIQATEDDGTAESRRRISREFRACHILSGCLHELNDQEQAVFYVDKAIERAVSPSDKVNCTQYKAYLLFCNKKYEACIDICDEILNQENRYLPAVLQRQEAAYKLHRGQQVVDDYYRAISIYPGYYKPYMLAAEVFFYSGQYEDANNVLERARENQVEFSANMRLFEVKILRNLARSSEDRRKPFAIAEDLLKDIDNPESDIEDKSEVIYEIALLYWDDDELDKALENLETAIDQNPKRLQYRMVRGHIYLDKKEYNKALTEYGAAEEGYANSPALYYNCGLCQEGLGMKVLAMEQFEKALECQEGYRDACEKLANYYKERYNATYDEADYEKALTYLNRQLAVRENCYYLVERGRLYMNVFKLQEAIRDFQKALEYSPKDWASYNNMGCCYKYLGQFEKAIECLEKAVECMEDDDKSVLPYSNMADCYEALGDYRKAIECYEKDLEMFPDRKVFRKEIGLLYQYLGEYDNALKYYNMGPELDDYYDNVASVYYLMGKKLRVTQTYDKGIRNASKDKKGDRYEELAVYYRTVARDLKKAEINYKKALAEKETPSDKWDLERQLAQVYFLMKRPKDAMVHARKALEYFKKSGNGTEEDYLNFKQYRPARLMRFAWIYICLGETEKGLEMLHQMNQGLRCRQCRHKGCYESYEYLADYYETIGDTEKVRENCEKSLELNDHFVTSTVTRERLRKL